MKPLLLVLICHLALLLTAQGNSAEIPPAVMFKQLSTTEGLSNNSVRSIYRDNRGFLWVGTESGQNQDSTNTTATPSSSITRTTPTCRTMPSAKFSKDRTTMYG